MRGQLVVLEPRQGAARAAARRMASERRVRLGEEIGYPMRFESKASASARLLVVTEGVLRINASDSAKGASLSWVSTLKCAA